MADLRKTANKLVKALNTVAGYKLTFSNKQFMGREGFPINYYCLSQASWDEDKRKYISDEIYSTTSMTRMVFFLRDAWYIYQGKELPTDQELWNKVRKGLMEDGKYRTWILSEISDRECE